MATTPEILPSARSSGVATVVAMLSGLAPGRSAVTTITGKSTCGNGATGNNRQASSPATSNATANRQIPTGLSINSRARLIRPALPHQLWHGDADSVDQRKD